MLPTLIIVLVAYLGLHTGLYKIFEERGEAGWKAFVPIYSELIWCRIVGRPATSVIWLWIPVIGFFVGVGMLIDLARSYGKHGFGQHFLIAALPFIFVPLMAFDKKLKFVEPGYTAYHGFKKALRDAAKEKDEVAVNKLLQENKRFHKKTLREWTEAAFFAIFAAHFIRLLLIEAYTIPTPSMEGSLLVGDFLLVSKMHYGIRMPMTPLSFPLLHNMLPITGGESYTKAIQWGYFRLPALQNVERFDPVVFNFPESDTVFGGFVDFSAQYHNIIKSGGNREVQLKDKRLITRPVDKRDHYIKRCVGIPGDKVEVREGLLYVNDQLGDELSGIQYMYRVFTQKNLDADFIEEKTGGTFEREMTRSGKVQIDQTTIFMSRKGAEIFAKIEGVDSVVRVLRTAGQAEVGIFPYNPRLFAWNIDNYGPITIPKKGVAISLTPDNIDLYRRVISAYEGNQLEVKEGQIVINGTPTNSFTPAMDYYWMMGDNRNQSADSRSWGFVPEDHIVGKPLLVCWSTRDEARGGGVRWNRIFMGASGR
jgi:signal peptidase I